MDEIQKMVEEIRQKQQEIALIQKETMIMIQQLKKLLKIQ